VLFRLAVVQRARETGFTLEEIRELFFGFPPGTRPPKRWHELSQRKIAELRNRMKRLKLMETLLKRVEKCRCDALDECGERILRQSDQESQKLEGRSRTQRSRSHLDRPKKSVTSARFVINSRSNRRFALGASGKTHYEAEESKEKDPAT